MQPTPFLKRVFASLITVATVTTLASASLHAAEAEKSYDETNSFTSEGNYTAKTQSEDADKLSLDYTITANQNYGFKIRALLLENSAAVGLIDAKFDIDAIGSNYLYGIDLNEGTSAGSIEAIMDIDAEEGVAYGIYNSGSIGSNDLTSSAIDADIAIDAKGGYAIYNTESGEILGDITGTLSITASNSSNYNMGLYNNGTISGTLSSIITCDGGRVFAVSNEGTIDKIIIESTTNGEGEIYGIKATSSAAVYAINNTGTINQISADIIADSTGSTSYGIYTDGGTIGKIGTTNDNSDTPTITVSAYSTAIGVRSLSSGTIGSISATISATSSNDDSYGVYTYQGSIGSIEGTIESTSETETAYGIYSYYYNTTTSEGIGNVSSDITVTAEAGDAYGVYNYFVGKIADLSGDIKVTASDDAVGVYNYYSSFITSISGTIDVEGGSSAIGISNDGNGDTYSDVIYSIDSSISASSDGDATGIYNKGALAQIGAIDGEVKAESTGGQAKAIDIESGYIFELSGTVSAKAVDGDATGVAVGSTAYIGPISADITAETTGSGTAYGIYTESSYALQFTDGASVKATSTSGAQYALYSTTDLTLTASASTDIITITGDIVSSGELTFDTGVYTIDALTITAESITINSGAFVEISSDVTLSSISASQTLTKSASTVDINFYIDSIDNLSDTMLSIEGDASITNLGSIYITLSDDVLNSLTETTDFNVFSDEGSSISDAQVIVQDVSGYQLDSSYSDGVLTLTPDVIPEPSTATLSLLALAGLCIRRRRKAA